MTEPQKIEEATSPSIWPAIKIGALVLAIGLVALISLIVSTVIAASLIGNFLAFVWFVLLLIVYIVSGVVGVGKYMSMLPSDNYGRRSRW